MSTKKQALLSTEQPGPFEDLEKYFGDPPLMGSERLEDWISFRNTITDSAKPNDFIGRLLVRDLAQLWWELRRARLWKAQLIRSKQQAYLSGAPRFTRADYEREKLLASNPPTDDDDASGFFKKKDPVESRKAEDPDTVALNIYLQNADNVEFFDGLIAQLESRRSCLLREIERRHQIVARNADNVASDLVDAEFTEVEE